MRGHDDSEDLTEVTISVLSHYGAVQIPGGYGWQNMRCCFHPDRNASGRVNLQAGAYKCQACDASGDLVGLVAWREGIDRASAAIRIKEIAGDSANRLSKRTGRKRSSRVLGGARFEQGDTGFFRTRIRK